MRIAGLVVAGMVGLAGCGGSDPPKNGSPPTNKYTGTLTITGAAPAGTSTCQATHTVTFTAATGASVHTVAAAGGDCLQFVNDDSAAHQPSTHGTPSCPELNAPASLAQAATFTTAPLDGTKTCYWQDALNPPPPPMPGDPGY